MTSRFLPFYLLVFSIALCVLACDQKPVDVFPIEGELHWNEIDRFPRVSWNNVIWGSGADDVYVGSYGGEEVLRHFDGKSWAWVSPGTATEVVDIWGSGPSDVYAATDQGVKHFDGVDWVNTGVDGNLVVGSSADQVYVFNRYAIHRFNGAGWDTLRTFSDPYAFFTTALALPGGELIAGRSNYYEPDSLLRWDGVEWTTGAPPGVVRALWGLEPDDFMAAGWDPSTNSGAIWRWDGSQWNPMPLSDPVSTVREIAGVGVNEAYAGTCCAGALLRFDGATWQTEFLQDSESIHTVWASSSADIYVASDDDVLHNDGSGWSTISAGKPRYAEIVWAESPQRLVVVGWGSVYRYDHGTWTDEDLGSFGGSPTAIVGYDWNDLYISDSHDGVLHYDGTQWSLVSDEGSSDLSLTPDGFLFATTFDGLSRWDGATWTHEDTADYAYAVWAANRDYAIVLGGGTLWKYKNSALEVIVDEAVSYTDVWGLSASEVYITGRDGILVYDGSSFELFGPPEGRFETITGTSSEHIIAVGMSTLFSRNGTIWTTSRRADDEQYFDFVPALDGSIVRLIGDPRTEIFSLSHHRP